VMSLVLSRAVRCSSLGLAVRGEELIVSVSSGSGPQGCLLERQNWLAFALENPSRSLIQTKLTNKHSMIGVSQFPGRTRWS
jgi:hypothetical protein